MQYIGLAAFNEIGNGFVNDRQVVIAVMVISLRSDIAVSYTHLDVYKRQHYLGLTTFYERGNGFISDREVDIAVMCISLRSVMTCSTSV